VFSTGSIFEEISSDMKKHRLYNQLRHQLKEEKLHIYEPGVEFHKLSNQQLL
jgi:hypothetical protein